MSDSEGFLARWSRLKRESGRAESVADEAGLVGPFPVTDEPAAPVFDPASVPPIESIVADTDIRPFLEACVPAELTRAALRSAWSADPAIRDFIGIAESQWDFNDPASIPGFGSHAGFDRAPNLLGRSVGDLNAAAGGLPESSRIVAPPVLPATDPVSSEPGDEHRQVAALSDRAQDAHPEGPAVQFVVAESIPARTASAVDLGPRTRHSHGGALPE